MQRFRFRLRNIDIGHQTNIGQVSAPLGQLQQLGHVAHIFWDPHNVSVVLFPAKKPVC